MDSIYMCHNITKRCRAYISDITSKQNALHMHYNITTRCREYRGCAGGNVPDFGRMFLKLKYTDITQNTYTRSWTVTEIMVIEKCGLLAVPHTVPVSRDVSPIHCACLSFSLQPGQVHSRCEYQKLSLLQLIVRSCKVFGTLRTTMTLVGVFM